ILSKGVNVCWYLIGYGQDESQIRDEILKAGVTENVVILGKKSNPYPYIQACDIYVRPSRYEGNSVTVREAQMLEKPVVITNYSTASSQLEDGVDGFIVPLDNEGCAQGIVDAIGNRNRIAEIKENLRKRDFSNRKEIGVLEKLFD
ncbi:MAG: glycosyltransferase, partial [Bacteroidales bacterium]|nr:glycosyltransferase [Bacteroidales bacterium]